jgi:integrase
MNKTLGILFYIKSSKINKKNLVPIYLRITVDGARVEISTNRQIEVDKWDNLKQRCVGKTELVKSINIYLDTLRTKVYDHQRLLIDNNQPVTASTIKESMLGTSKKSKTILEIFEKHNKEFLQLVGREYAIGTYKRYETTLMHLKSFMLHHYKTIDKSIKEVTPSFIREFDFYLRTIKNIQNNSTVKYVKNFQKIVRIALVNRDLEIDPFLNYKRKLNEVVKNILTQNELNIIESKIIENERLDIIRDIFLFCCYTGLAYIDVQKLTKENISFDDFGKESLRVYRTKTKILCRIPLLPVPKKLLEKYKDNPKCLNTNRLLPVPSNQKLNNYLKELAAICNINKEFSSHDGRRIFGTTVTLSNGVPLESVSSMLGHTNTIMTQKYAKIVNQKLLDDMNQLEQKFNDKENRSV